MKNFFTWQDFNEYIPKLSRVPETTASDMAERANIKFNALIESWPVIATQKSNPFVWKMCAGSMDGVMEVARLAFVKDYHCNHEPQKNAQGFISPYRSGTAICTHCGIEIKPEWRAR